MCVKMNRDIVKIIYSTNFEAVWEICLIKCDFTTEIQPWKMDSGTEPVFFGVIGIKKTRKSDIYYIYYVSERSLCKIHASGRLSLNYAFVKSVSNWTSTVSQYETQTFDKRLKTTLTLDMSGSDVIRMSRLTVNHSAALKRSNQTTFLALKKIAATQILSQYMTSNYLTSCEWKTKYYRFTLVNKHEGTAWHFPVTFDLNGVEGIVCCKHRKVCPNYCHEAAIKPFPTSDHNFAPFILLNQPVNSYLDDLCVLVRAQ